MDQRGGTLPPHVLIFPLPLQGPVSTMLKLAELLCLAGFHVTFLNTDHNHRRLLRHSDIQSRFNRHPKFRFETVSDGLPDDHPRSADRILDLFDSMEAITKPQFREILTSGCLSSGSERPATCIVADGMLGFAIDVAEEIEIPLFYFDTISPCGIWVYLCLPKLIEAGELPFKGDDLDEPITSVPSMEGFLRRRDLPSFCRAGDLSDPIMQLVFTENRQIPRARGLILNTFEDLEGPTLSHVRTICSNIYAIGPLHSHLKSRLEAETPSVLTSSNSLWKEDESCLAWLDAQPPKSVIYVSIGSLAVMTSDEVMEFWQGLVNSGKRFLWVRRPSSVIGNNGECHIPAELFEGTNERGYIVGWAPQERVLAHWAVAGFLTHSGWNSTLESVVAGVPMICWPCGVDQQVNSRVVSHVWRVGLDMKDTCDRVTVEKMVRDLMEVRRDEFVQSADRMAQLARKSVSEGGSSYSDLDRLIEDIRLMSVQAQCVQCRFANKAKHNVAHPSTL